MEGLAGMQDLRLVAADERGSHLVLRSADGEKFLVSIDERLRAAVRGDRSRFGAPAGDAKVDLRPRDIQARIRAGESAEEIARTAGVPVDRVRRFEGPVLAERAHVADLAQRSTVRRPGLDGRPTSLGDCVADRLTASGIAADGVGWDSWRVEDGRWVVQVTYSHEDRTKVARYLYDVRARSVVAENDEGRWLTGELLERPQEPASLPRPAPVARPVATHRRPAVQMEVPLPEVEVPAATPEATQADARGTGTEGTTPPRGPRSRRASVPAWDDIVFGGRRTE
jgi:hypothetical protein